MNRTLITLAMTAIVTAPVPAFAELKPFQKVAEAKFTKDIDKSASAAAAKCGAKIAVKADFATFKEEDWKGKSVASFCGAAVDAVRKVCEEEAYKPEVAKQVKTVSCEFGGGENVDGSMKLGGGTFTYAMNKAHKNVGEAAVKVLKKSLDGN